MMLDWYKKAHEYKDRLEEAQETIRQLRDILRPKGTFPIEWHLTPAETRVLTLLALRGEVTHGAAQIAIAKHPEIEYADPAGQAKVTMHKLRRKVEPFGIKIGTAWNVGYYLTDAGLAAAKAALRVVDDVEN